MAGQRGHGGTPVPKVEAWNPPQQNEVLTHLLSSAAACKFVTVSVVSLLGEAVQSDKQSCTVQNSHPCSRRVKSKKTKCKQNIAFTSTILFLAKFPIQIGLTNYEVNKQLVHQVHKLTDLLISEGTQLISIMQL